MNDVTKTAEQVADNARQVADDTVTQLRDVASDASAAASKAVDTGKTYAKAAVNATGKKISSAGSQMGDTCDALIDAIHKEPVKAVLVTAVLSAALTALVISALPKSSPFDRF